MSNGPFRNGFRTRTVARDHQVRDLVQSWGKPAWARLHEMRTGKGVLTVYEMDALAQAGLASRFLVVCPKRVISTWQEMIVRHAHSLFHITTQVPPRGQSGHTILLMNYDRVWERVDGKMMARRGLVDWMPEYVVADEAHKIKNRTSGRSKAMHTLGRLATVRRVLTGTPDPTSWADYHSIYKFLDPTIFGTWASFASNYLLLDWYRQVVGYRNTDELAQKVHSIASRVTRAECFDVPPVEERTVEVELPVAVWKVYRNMARALYAELEGDRTITAPIVLTKLLRLAQITGGAVKTDDGQHVWIHDAKIYALIDVLEEVLADAGAKAVVFARFRPEITRISAALSSAHVGHVTLHGDTPDDATVRQTFAEQPDCRVLVSQIATGSLGVDLSAAEAGIFYSWDFDSATYRQAYDRIWKTGSKLTYFHLVVPKTIDETMLRVVQGKIDRSTLLLDNWEDLVNGKPYVS